MNSRRMNQTQLAEAAGCTQPAISDYLKGRIPSGEILVAIARVLGTTAEELLSASELHPHEMRDTAAATHEERGPADIREPLFDELTDWKNRAREAERELEALRKRIRTTATQLQRLGGMEQSQG